MGAAGEEGGDLFGLTGDGEVRRLTDDGGSYGPSFSPDGSRIVFSSIGDDGLVSDGLGPSGLDLYVMAADGTGRRRLFDGDEDRSPAWSPDGDQIAFVRQGRIFVVDPADDESDRPLVDKNGGGSDTDPAWSSDGTQLAFVRTDPDGSWHLMVADADGSGARSVLDRPNTLGTPSWSSDGTTLAFTEGGRGGPTRSIALLDLHNGSVQTVLEHGSAPVWSASGRIYGYGHAPGIADFSGRWRVVELAPDGAHGFGTGRAVSSVDPIGYLYDDVGIDVPRCDGSDTAPLTSEADVPDGLVVTDPATGTDVTVLPREQALALLATYVSGLPAGVELEAKLVDTAAPEAAALGRWPGQLVWVVVTDVSPVEWGITVFDATTGVLFGSRGIDKEAWRGLVDLAP